MEWSQTAQLIAVLSRGDEIISESFDPKAGTLTVLVRRAADGAVTEEVRRMSDFPPIMDPQRLTEELLRQALIDAVKFNGLKVIRRKLE